VAGDDTALYNALLLTLRDAAKIAGPQGGDRVLQRTGQRQHGGADDVRAVAEDEGIPIYVISTNEVNKDAISSGVLRRIAQRTGGKAYWARTWQKQVEAFEDIREDLSNSYTVTTIPLANPNEGFRKIAVEITSDPGKKYRVHTRPGYRPSRSF
jgi:Ca-activated chloride channel family protein